MALSAEFGLHVIATPAPLSGTSIKLACSSARSRNCLTIPPTPISCCVPTRGWESLCWLHPVLSPRRRAVPKRKWVQFRFNRDCSARAEASDPANRSSEQLPAEGRGSPKYFPGTDGNLSPASSRQYGSAAPSGMASATPLDLLSNAPTYPSSDDKQLSFKGGTAEGKSGTVSVSSDNFISPRQIFRSIGSRSVSSRPSIPGKFSKYSKRGKSKRIFDTNPTDRKYLHSKVAVLDRHEVTSQELGSSFTTQSKTKDNSMPIPATSHADQQSSFPSRRQFAKKKPEIFTDPAPMPATELPFQLQFSYSENPKVNPIGFREPQFSPFGPTTMPRPWTGRAPLPKSKKKPKELDSFNPPPPGTKGVKAVHPPGPYKEGEGPKIAQSREEILGEPLTKEEITKLVEICNKEQRQINLGRDGLVHNMLDLIHCHWKRRRVIKIKCKGVPTVDMDNVCYHVEDKSGGKIIHRAGGAMYLFRGRNYNTKYRPHIPLMLWKPAAPIYPKLIVPAPGGLTKEEADAMRKRGRKVQPICKLAKNGVYLNLVKDVRSAFEIDELVRVDCTGLNPSDYKKIGAKLKDLVPCILLSFDKEHILMWRGNDWKSTESGSITASNLEVEKKESAGNFPSDSSNLLPAFVDEAEDRSGLVFLEAELAEEGTCGTSSNDHLAHREVIQVNAVADRKGDQSQMSASVVESSIHELDEFKDGPQKHSKLLSDKFSNKAIKARNDDASELDTLWEQAVAMGDALPLEESCLDPDTVFQKAAVFKDIKSVQDPSCLELDTAHERNETENLESIDEQQNSSNRFYKGNSDQGRSLSTPIMAEPLGSLPVDELAKLLES